MSITICNAFLPGCTIDWTAVGSVATAVAVIVALRTASSERRRLAQEKREAVRDVCSAADRIVAYHDVSKQILRQPIVYVPQIEALESIFQHVLIQKDVIDVIVHRQGLTDGAVMTALTAKKLADCFDMTGGAHGLPQGIWDARLRKLEGGDLWAAIASSKSSAVRSFFRWAPSQAAEQIRQKYRSIAAECQRAQQTNTAPAYEPLDATPY